jgi:hypothetical protein
VLILTGAIVTDDDFTSRPTCRYVLALFQEVE